MHPLRTPRLSAFYTVNRAPRTTSPWLRTSSTAAGSCSPIVPSRHYASLTLELQRPAFRTSFFVKPHCGARRAIKDIPEMAKKDKEEKGKAALLKTPKGTRDWTGSDMVLRERIFSSIVEVFKRHGACALDTPVFELKEILTGKYGEDSKLIYDIADQGGELCSLRYDLTVPLARFLAMNSSIQNFKRYHLAKVYRRDQPAVAKGRMREFYQCDLDIAGIYDPMIPDAEIIRIIVEVFESLEWKDFTIKINHRKVLDGLFLTAGVPSEKVRAISSAVDKLDKSPWEVVKKEMVEEKGLDESVADKIGEYVKHKGGRDVVELLKADASLMANEGAKKAVDDMGLLFTYLDAFDAVDRVSFDLSLARGLDYYTGVIYEVVTEGSAPAEVKEAGAKPAKTSKKPVDADEDRSNDPTLGIGSVAAGGRYDELVNMFAPKRNIPCVGISFGVDRIFSIMKARLEKEAKAGNASAMRASEVDVYVMAFGGANGLLKERMSVARELWTGGVKTEFSAKVKPKLPQQFKAAETGGIPLAVILGEDELAAGNVRLKVLGLPEGHADKEGKLVSRSELIAEVKKLLEAPPETTLPVRPAAP